MEILEPSLGPSVLGAVLYPSCGSVHPLKAMRALALEASRAGVRTVIESEVIAIERYDKNYVTEACPRGEKWKVTARYTHGDKLRPEEKGDSQQKGTYGVHTGDTIVIAEEVVIASGGFTDHVLRDLISTIDLDNMKFKSLVTPVVGQMFRTATVRGEKGKSINYLIAGYDSHEYWESNKLTSPPGVTHERRDDDDGGGWGDRLTHHLYGKQTPDGRFLFGGDRRVHPPQIPSHAHSLPRNLPELHEGPYNHAIEILPMIANLPVEHVWGGVMPFSVDGRPILGEVGTSGIYVISGLGGSGFMCGPMTGLLLAYLMSAPEPELRNQLRDTLAPVSPTRFFST